MMFTVIYVYLSAREKYKKGDTKYKKKKRKKILKKRFFFFAFSTHLPGEPRVHGLGAPFAQERSVLDAFGQLCLGPHATGTGVPHLQVIGHCGRVSGQFEKAKAAVHACGNDATAAATAVLVDRHGFHFDIVVVAVAVNATASAPVSVAIRSTVATVTGQRTLVVASASVRIAAATTTSIVATACKEKKKKKRSHSTQSHILQ